MKSAPNHSIAIVEDEAVIREEIAFQLRHNGFTVSTFESAAQFYRALAVSPITATVLDIGLPGEDGLAICRHLRTHDKRIGIVFVTARSMRDERLAGLETGADAYLVKPVDIDELILVLNRLSERFTLESSVVPPPQVATATIDSWLFKPGLALLLAPNAVQVHLTISEVQLLSALYDKNGQVCTHAELGSALGIHPDDLDKHRIEVVISRLRSKAERQSGQVLPLHSHRGIGYGLNKLRVK